MKSCIRTVAKIALLITLTAVITQVAQCQQTTGSSVWDGYNRQRQFDLQQRYFELAKKEQEARLQYQRDLLARADRDRADREAAMKSINEANRRNEEINRVIKDIIDSRARLSQSALKSSEPDHLFSRIDGGSLIPKDIPQVETVKEIGYSPVLAEDRLKTIVKVLHKSVKP